MSSCADYRPPLVEQLHGPDPTAGSDCGICCARMAIMFATCGKLNPSPDKIRAQSGLDAPNPPPDDYSTTVWEYQTAVNAFDDEAQHAGYEGIKASVHEREPWETLADTIKGEDRWVSVCVDYGVLNDREPAKSGDPGFNGSHFVGVFGYAPAAETGDGTNKVRVYDPLCDGRRDSIPKGPTWWKLSTLRDAADGYTGGAAGTATWCTTPRAEWSSTEPEPPPDECETRESSATALLADAQTLLVEHGVAALTLALRITQHLGGNAEGRELPVHSGASPDGP